jgi:hypothetical protein
MDSNLEKKFLLFFTFIASFSFFIKTIITNSDIPNGWAVFLGAAWGALLGVQEFTSKMIKDEKMYKEYKTLKDDKINKENKN